MLSSVTTAQLTTSAIEDGLLSGWRLLPGEDGIVFLVTEPENPLLFGAFGNLLVLRFDGLDVGDSFDLGRNGHRQGATRSCDSQPERAPGSVDGQSELRGTRQ